MQKQMKEMEANGVLHSLSLTFRNPWDMKVDRWCLVTLPIPSFVAAY